MDRVSLRAPVGVEGRTVEAAITDLAMRLHEHALDWDERLCLAPNHVQNWALVQLVNLSTDEELVDWIEDGGQ